MSSLGGGEIGVWFLAHDSLEERGKYFWRKIWMAGWLYSGMKGVERDKEGEGAWLAVDWTVSLNCKLTWLALSNIFFYLRLYF